MSRNEFIKLSKKKQTDYIEHFPNSSHRFHMKGRKAKLAKTDPKKLKAVEKKEAKVKDRSDPSRLRRLRKHEYDALDEKGKKQYGERFQKSKHLEKVRKPRVRKGDKVVDGRETAKQASRRRKELGTEVDKERETLHVNGAGTINKESVQALAAIKPEHLHQAAANIESKREEVHELLDLKLKDKPNFAKRSLAAVRDLFSGTPDGDEDDTDEDEDSPKRKKSSRTFKDSKKQRDTLAILATVAKASLIIAGIGLLATGAAPLALIIGKGLLEVAGDMRSLAGTMSEEELDKQTIDEIITQTISFLKNADLQDLKEQSREDFRALASSSTVDAYTTIYNALQPMFNERPKGKPGENFFGTLTGTPEKVLSNVVRALNQHGILAYHETSKGDSEIAYFFHFTKKASHKFAVLGFMETYGIYHVKFKA